MSLEDMPDDVLIKLLGQISPRDVAKTKRVNKRFNQLVERYNIGKPRVKEFSIESRLSTPPKLGRFRLGIQKSSAKRRLVLTMKRDKGVKRVERIDDPTCSKSLDDNSNSFVQENMRKVVLNEKLSFDGVTIDSNFHKMLTAKWNDLSHVTTLSLTFCQLQLSWKEFSELLSRMTLRHLYLDFCTFNPELISDKVLLSLPNLETLKIQPKSHCYFNGLTDRTLNFWSQKEKPMANVQIYNCASGITVEGIKMLLATTIAQQDKSSTIDWDFGLVFEPTQTGSVLLSLIFSPGLQLSVSDDFRSRRVQLHKKNLQLAFNIFCPVVPNSPQA